MKNGIPSQIESLTFLDSDLTTPKHDEIMCWLDENAEKICRKLFKIKHGLDTKIWEYPIFKSIGCGNTYAGLAPEEFWPGYMSLLNEKLSNEKVGHVDLMLTFSGQLIAFEVKSTIPSLGDLICQVRHYESYVRAAFVVVSPDTRFRKQIENQNIYFVPYPEKQRKNKASVEKAPAL